MAWVIASVLVVLWYFCGRTALAYAHGREMDCRWEWDNCCAVILWPFFFCCIVAEHIGDAAKRRAKAQELLDAQVKAALKELNP